MNTRCHFSNKVTALVLNRINGEKNFKVSIDKIKQATKEENVRRKLLESVLCKIYVKCHLIVNAFLSSSIEELFVSIGGSVHFGSL